MKKALITGSQGFVGPYLREELNKCGYVTVGLDRNGGEHTITADLLNTKQIQTVIAHEMPDLIFHLAGQSSVSRSWVIPQQTIELNVVAAVNLMEAVRVVDPNCRMIMVGSSDQYGNLGKAGQSVNESIGTHPQTPYAVSKKAQEEMAGLYVRSYGMQICMTRSFNHGGAGQNKGFLIPDFASGIVAVERGIASCLRVGNLEARRDFTHVKDVVRAYRLIAEKGRSGEIYNVGSGRSYSAREILEKFLSMTKCNIPVERDVNKMRPSDTPVICCDHSKLTKDTGWVPRYSLDEILKEVLEDWRNREII